MSASDGWQLTPVLALDTIRLVAELGGRLERDLRSAVLPMNSRDELLERINTRTLRAGPKPCLDSASQLAHDLSRELQVAISPGVPREKRDRWGRLAVHRRSYKSADGASIAELELWVSRRAAGGADGARAAVGRRSGAARSPAGDGGIEGCRLGRRRVRGWDR
ncbi:MAG: hypothetical protein ACLP0J_03325 [Solirubrobacteraceae bacterium]